MNRLSHSKVQSLIATMESNAVCGKPDLWERWANEHGDNPAIVEFPLGELTNPGLAGFVWAWQMKNKIRTSRIEEGDRFNAQGLEGKAIVETTLTVALMVYREIPVYRCQVRV